MSIKWAGKSRDTIEGLLAPFGGPIKGRDLQGEYFSPNTDFALEWFDDWQRPLLYNHGLDSEIKTSVVGRIKVSPSEKGLWMQAQLEKAHEYYDEIAKLVDDGALGLSSGSVSHLVSTSKSGEIKSWPLIEGSMTPTPANPDARAGYTVKSADAIEHLAVLGVEAPDGLTPDEVPVEEPEAVKAETTELVAIESDFEFEGITDGAVKALTAALTPQALHDAAVASGAACKSGETHEPEPAPLLAVAGKSVETETPVDLDAIQARLSAKAVAVALELLG